MPLQAAEGQKVLQDHIAESSASRTQRDKEPFPLPFLEEVEIMYDKEYVLDFRGHKHLEREANDQHYHVGHPMDPSPSYRDFAMPGQASADTLRKFLRENLQPDQVTDEYGKKCVIADISNDQLLVLQAKLWVTISSNRPPVKATTQRPSRSQNLIAGHVSKISQLLEEGYVFVLNEDLESRACDYMGDLRTTTEHTCHFQIVKLEPLIHWGTIVPAESLRYTLPFRRYGELMKNMDKPEFKSYVRQVTNLDAPSYCTDCLGYLWSKCCEARDTIVKLQSSASRPRYRFSENHSLQRPALKMKCSKLQSTHADSLTISEILSLNMLSIGTAKDKLDEPHGKALLQIDGANDFLDTFHIGRSDAQDLNAVWISSDSDQSTKSLETRKNSLLQKDPCTIHLCTPSSSAGHIASYAPPTGVLATTATKSSDATEKAKTSDHLDNNSPVPQIIDLITPPRAKKRNFGQELDTNTKALLIEVRRSPRKHKTNLLMSQSICRAPVKPSKLPGSVQKIKSVPKWAKESKKRKTAVAHEETAEKEIRITDTNVSISPILMHDLTKDPEPQNLLLSGARLGLSSPERLQQAIRLAPVARACSPPKLTLYFAKRSAEPELPCSITGEELTAFHRTHPTPTSKICFCNKPACHGKFKKGVTPQIAQCLSKYCRFRWFHYACLDQSEKGKARWGTLVCPICRVEHELTEMDRRNGWTAAKMTYFPPLWTKLQIEEQLPGLGGVISQANPYNLDLELQFEPEFKRHIEETGALGGLQELDYPQSRPEILEEAYLYAGAFAELLARRAEGDQDAERNGEIYGEEEEDSSEEMYDEETEESL